MRKVNLFGLEFSAADSLEEVLEDVWNSDSDDSEKWPLMITPNVDQIVKLSKGENSELAGALSRARWILPDGQPLVAVSKIKGGEFRMPARLPGSDFFPMIWQRICKSNRTAVFLLPDENLGSALQREHSRVFWHVPPYFQSDDREQLNRAAEALTEICLNEKPAFLFLGLGFPKQEIIALAVFERLKEAGAELPKTFLLGASFEFYFGIKKRAPQIWQKLGLEFMHRFLSEPRRMFKRYFVDDLAFLPIAWAEIFSGHSTKGSRK